MKMAAQILAQMSRKFNLLYYVASPTMPASEQVDNYGWTRRGEMKLIGLLQISSKTGSVSLKIGNR